MFSPLYRSIKMYTKTNLSDNEYYFTRITSEHNISPKLLSGNSTSITLEKWPSVLLDVPREEWFHYKEPVFRCLHKLHCLGIMHCDISEENIVVNRITKDARLIDFGMSKTVSDIDFTQFNEQNDFNAQCTQDLFAYDFVDFKLLFG